MGIPWETSYGMGMGQINMSHGQPYKYPISTGKVSN